MSMNTGELTPSLADLFSELVDGAGSGAGAFVLNSGDIGLLRSLDTLRLLMRRRRPTPAPRLPRTHNISVSACP